MKFRAIRPSYIPLSPREGRKILDSSEADYPIALEIGFLQRSLQYKSRYSNETNIHTVVDLVVCEIVRHLIWPNQKADRLAFEVEQVVDDLCGFHKGISKMEIWRIEKYYNFFTKNFYQNLGMVCRSPIWSYNSADIDTIKDLAKSIWSKIPCRTVSKITNINASRNSHIASSLASMVFSGSSSEFLKNLQLPKIKINVAIAQKIPNTIVRLGTIIFGPHSEVKLKNSTCFSFRQCIHPEAEAKRSVFRAQSSYRDGQCQTHSEI